jgi:hypothetical protein
MIDLELMPAEKFHGKGVEFFPPHEGDEQLVKVFGSHAAQVSMKSQYI